MRLLSRFLAVPVLLLLALSLHQRREFMRHFAQSPSIAGHNLPPSWLRGLVYWRVHKLRWYADRRHTAATRREKPPFISRLICLSPGRRCGKMH